MTPAELRADPLFLLRNQQTLDQCLASIRDAMLTCPLPEVMALWDEVLQANRLAHEDAEASDLERVITSLAVVGMCQILLAFESENQDRSE